MMANRTLMPPTYCAQYLTRGALSGVHLDLMKRRPREGNKTAAENLCINGPHMAADCTKAAGRGQFLCQCSAVCVVCKVVQNDCNYSISGTMSSLTRPGTSVLRELEATRRTDVLLHRGEHKSHTPVHEHSMMCTYVQVVVVVVGVKSRRRRQAREQVSPRGRLVDLSVGR